MDLWVVAVATGASYLAKYWQKVSKEPFPGLSSSNATNNSATSPFFLQHVIDKPYTFPHEKSHLPPDYGSGHQNRLDGKGGETALFETGHTLSYDDYSIFPSAENFGCMSQEYMDRLTLDGGVWVNVGDRSETSSKGTGAYGRSARAKSSLRSRRNLQYLKPLSALESCLLAQLYKEYAETESVVVTPPSSPCARTLRPFVVTDGSRMISRPSTDSFSAQIKDERDNHQREYHPGRKEDVIGIPPLPMMGPTKCLIDSKHKKENNPIKELNKPHGRLRNMQLRTQSSPSEAVLLWLGISIGIVSSIVANNREMTKLQELLKQKENLVKDLQEEIEMKESVTVKELANEDRVLKYPHESYADDRKPCTTTRKSVSNMVRAGSDDTSDVQKTAKNMDIMCNIEAELEAELERLELNMKGSTSLRRQSEDYEFEHNLDSEANLVDGELRTDLISRRDDSDYTSSRSTGAPESANYAVSPHELCLRLHELAESRMLQRIMELEAELERRQKRVENLESEQRMSVSWRGFFSHSEESSSSAQDSPVTIEAQQPFSSPLVMDLSGEALDAYNEAREELKHVHRRINVNESNFEVQSEKLQKLKVDRSETAEEEMFFQDLLRGTIDDELLHRRNCPDEDEIRNDGGDDTEDDGDDMAMLIRQIVERTRQGSPAILHAHRAMASLDKSGQ